MKKGKRAKPQEVVHRITFAPAERVLVLIDQEQFPGRIKRIEQDVHVVRLDPQQGQEKGDIVRVSRARLVHQMCHGNGCDRHATKRDAFCDPCRAKIESMKGGGKEQVPFKESGIKWQNDRTSFHFETSEGVRFYGWYRRTRQRNSDAVAHCIDVYAKRTDAEGKEKDVAVDSIVYLEKDPRENIRSVNADLIALANKWFFQRLNGKATILDDLVIRADKPTLKINSMQTLDMIILRLKEYRHTALHSGGERYLEIKGDGPEPPVGIRLNLTAQAFVLKGKVPKIGRGISADIARKSSGRGVKGGDVKTRSIMPVVASGNVDDLMKALIAAKDAGDKATCRQIRGTLREMGIRGGLRGYNSQEKK